MTCDIAIVGGGAGGLRAAVTLSQHKKGKVCLFEEMPSTGGRIQDVRYPQGNAVPGNGAWRVGESEQMWKDFAAAHNVSSSQNLFL